jgi:methionyl aminopeptidase
MIKYNNLYSELITLKNDEWLLNQRIAGSILKKCFAQCQEWMDKQSDLDCISMSNLLEELILDNHATPTFKNYKGFPAAVCISINKELLHGIPKNIHLSNSDVITFDLGVTYDNSIVDAARTYIFGDQQTEHIKIIKATKDALQAGIDSIAVGKRLGCIGHSIYNSATRNGYDVIHHYGGHGLDVNCPHASPFVSNKSKLNEGVRLQPGMTLAIEPQLISGLPQTRVHSDQWTVLTPTIGVHFEDTIFIHNDHVEILT